jgi:hypothetical protein
METSHEIFRKIRDSRFVLGIGILAATATILAGCGESKSEQSTTPLSRLDVSTLSAADAKQYIEVSEVVAEFSEDQNDPNKRLVNGVNDLYSRYQNPLQDEVFGCGWEQDITGWAGITSGDQEQVTEVNSRDAVEEVIRDRAIELATIEGKPSDAAAIVDRYIDDIGNITKQDVLAELADIVAKQELSNQ